MHFSSAVASVVAATLAVGALAAHPSPFYERDPAFSGLAARHAGLHSRDLPFPLMQRRDALDRSVRKRRRNIESLATRGNQVSKVEANQQPPGGNPQLPAGQSLNIVRPENRVYDAKLNLEPIEKLLSQYLKVLTPCKTAQDKNELSATFKPTVGSLHEAMQKPDMIPIVRAFALGGEMNAQKISLGWSEYYAKGVTDVMKKIQVKYEAIMLSRGDMLRDLGLIEDGKC